MLIVTLFQPVTYIKALHDSAATRDDIACQRVQGHLYKRNGNINAVLRGWVQEHKKVLKDLK